MGLGDFDVSQTSASSGSNCFTARSDLLIDQVMTFTPQANCSVNIKIYAANDGSSPVSGIKFYEKTFQVKYSGYNLINLGKKLGIPKGLDFSVIITTQTPDKKYFVPFELQDKDDPVNNPNVVLKGQSYVNINGTWSEITRDTMVQDKIYDHTFTFRMYNALVKALGFKGGKKAQKIKVKTKVKMKKGKKLKLKAKRTKGNGKLIYKISNPKKATVTSKGVVKAKKKGIVKITVYTLPTSMYKSAKKTVKVIIK